MPKPVTQAELAAIVAAYEAVEKDALRIRRKFRAGAAVEAGALECHNDCDPLQINAAAAYSLFGLTIKKATRRKPLKLAPLGSIGPAWGPALSPMRRFRARSKRC